MFGPRAGAFALGASCVLALAASAVSLAQQEDSEDAGTEDAAPLREQPRNPSIESGVAFVNLNRIFQESSYIDARLAEVNSEFTAREQELEQKVEELAQMREQHSRDRLTMTVAQRSEVTDRINEMELEIQRENRNLSEDKRLRFDSAQRELERTVLETIQEVSANRENFIVFDLSTILFADKRLEITDEVILRLDEADPGEAAQPASDQ